MSSLSLCMIVKDEALHLPRCLESVRGLFNDVVVADTGSGDDTVKIAKSFGARVYRFKWTDDFSAARNFSFSKAKGDFIMWLDADDVLSFLDKEKIFRLKQNGFNGADAVFLKYAAAFDKDGNATFSYFRERIVRRQKNFLWREPVHEYLETGGKAIFFDASVTHKKSDEDYSKTKSRNLNIYQKRVLQGEKLSPRGLYYYGRELFYHKNYQKAAAVFTEFLNGGGGFSEDNIAACELLARCYLELSNTKKALEILFSSFYYDLPRAEILCLLGNIYKEGERHEKALYYYGLAINSKPPKNCLGFVRQDYYDYIPLLESCVCLDKLGRKEEAKQMNDRAAKIKPDSEETAYNKRYFEENR